MNGFAIIMETDNNKIQGNLIGIEENGETAFPNARGVQIMNASGNLIGGTTPEERNSISGNSSIGIAVFGNEVRAGPNSFDNIITGNYLGTNAAGTAAVGNNDNIQVSEGAKNTIIGGLSPEERNIISGANYRGIVIASESTENTQIIGNLIGTDVTGTNAVPNTNRAINLLQGVSNTIIGGTEEGARNIISGNSSYAIAFQFSDASPGTIPVTNNVVLGNYIGVDITGATTLPNQDGILVSGLSENNVIGGDTPGARNIISGNIRFGIHFTGLNSKNNLVTGNYIGPDNDASSPLPNNVCVFFQTGANNNTIGGTAPGGGNLISGNSQGIAINNSSENEIIGNFIGTDSNGTGALGNGFGISITNGSTNNIIGGADPAQRNIISGNSAVGINIGSVSTQNNQILGNYIGVDVSGMESLANGGNGIQLAGVSNTIHGNVVSANSGSGISVLVGGDGNIITGNYIGTNPAGNTAMPNNTTGIWIRSDGNTIGGVTITDRNIISGNNQGGIRLFNFGTQVSDNVISGNYIGIAADGTTPLANNGSGIYIDLGSDNIVGGDLSSAGNLISGNSQHGIQILNAASSGNSILGNYIGTNTAGLHTIGNGTHGITIAGSANNQIGNGTPEGSNVIAYNNSDGIRIEVFGSEPTIGNSILQNSIHSNGLLGIDLGGNGVTENDPDDSDTGPNNLQNFAEISSATFNDASKSLTISYLVPSAPANSDYPLKVEFFSTNPDERQGKVFLGSGEFTEADFSNGIKETTLTIGDEFSFGAGNQITSTATDNSGNTSEFGALVTVVEPLSAPDAVVLLSPEDASVDVSINPTLSWQAAATAENYRVQVSLTDNFSDVLIDENLGNVTDYTAEGLAYETQHHWRVRASNEAGDGAWSQAWSFTTLDQLEPPSVPIPIFPEFQAYNIPINTSLIWEASERADKYRVQLSTESDFSEILIDQDDITETSFQLILDYQTLYYWRVKAYNDMDESDWSTTSLFATESELITVTNIQTIDPAGGTFFDEETGTEVEFPEGAVSDPTVIISGTYSQFPPGVIISGILTFLGTEKFESINFNLPVHVTVEYDPGNIPDGAAEKNMRVQRYTELTETWEELESEVNTNTKKVRASTDRFSVFGAGIIEGTVYEPGMVTLSSPEDDATDVPVAPTLSWQVLQNTDSYTLQVSAESEFNSTVIDQSGIDETFYQVSSLDMNATYFWRVRATNEAGDGEWSQIWSFTTEDEPLTAPDAVVLLSPEDAAENISIAPTLSWQAAATAQNYRVQVSLTSDFSDVLIDEVLGNVTEYSAEGLEYETDYFWRVRATNEAGDGEWSQVWSFTTEDEPSSPPGIVTLFSPADGATDVFVPSELNWQELQDDDLYTLQVSTGSDFTFTVVDQSGIVDTSYQVSNLDMNTIYYWRVRGVNQAGNGEWSQAWSFTTGELSPPGMLAVSTADNAPELSWDASPSGSVSGYNVYRAASPGALELVAELDASTVSYTDTEVPQGGSFYAVTATASGNSESAFTNVVSFFKVNLQTGSQWQLVSHAVSGAEADVSGSLVYGFENVYRSEQTLKPGNGYWIKDDGGANYTLAGPGASQLELDLNAGWNLVGGPAGALAVDDINDPTAILTTTPVYSYNGVHYEQVSELLPGSGYWLFAESAGQVSMSLDLTPAAASSSEILAAAETTNSNSNTTASEKDRLVVSSGGLSEELVIYGEYLTRDQKYSYLRPPLAPEQALDVRTSEGFSAMYGSSSGLMITAVAYPVTLRLEASAQGSSSYLLLGEDQSGATRQWTIDAGSEAVLTYPYERLSLQRVTPEELISETLLESGYPNPFNPTTNIRYRLVDQTEVLLEVYDLAGRRVATLVNQNQQSGAYIVQFDGSGLASGVYFVRLQAGSYINIQKLTLIK